MDIRELPLPQPWAHDPVFILYGGYIVYLTLSISPRCCAIASNSAADASFKRIASCFRCITCSGISVGVGESILPILAFTLASPRFLGFTHPISTSATACLTLSPRLRHILTPDEQSRMDWNTTPFSTRAAQSLDRVRPRAVRKETV